jgi:uncharacterized protein YdhG (YjbR/CyaY superfamily)
MKYFDSIDAYLAAIPSDNHRSALNNIRQLIHRMFPDVEETISYGLPSFTIRGCHIYFGAFKKHCSFFPGSTFKAFKEELRDFKTSKGTIQFHPEKPIPDHLIIAIIEKRIADASSQKS